jgi:hypothetical protein
VDPVTRVVGVQWVNPSGSRVVVEFVKRGTVVYLTGDAAAHIQANPTGKGLVVVCAQLHVTYGSGGSHR